MLLFNSGSRNAQSAVSSAKCVVFVHLIWAGSSWNGAIAAFVTMTISSTAYAITRTLLLAVPCADAGMAELFGKEKGCRAAFFWVVDAFSTSNITCTEGTPLWTAHIRLAGGMAVAINYRGEDSV